jgi:hypothetical protein
VPAVSKYDRVLAAVGSGYLRLLKSVALLGVLLALTATFVFAETSTPTCCLCFLSVLVRTGGLNYQLQLTHWPQRGRHQNFLSNS